MHKDELEMTFFCDQDWDQMAPYQQGRLCQQCDKVVVDVSAMTYEKFKQFNKIRKEEQLCMKVRHYGDGEVIFAEPVAPQHGGPLVDWLMARPKRLKAMSVAGAAALSLAACADSSLQAQEADAPRSSAAQVHFDKLNFPDKPKAKTSSKPPAKIKKPEEKEPEVEKTEVLMLGW